MAKIDRNAKILPFRPKEKKNMLVPLVWANLILILGLYLLILLKI